MENYVNRIFIDLIGREPLDTEMSLEVSALQNADLSEEARRTLIEKLQQDETVIPGDSTYKRAYYYRFYEVAKVRMIEGVEDEYLQEQLNNYNNGLQSAVAAGDSADAAFYRGEISEVLDIFAIPQEYMHGAIAVDQVFYRLIDNFVYDIINMNTFNFVNATFYDLFFRFPTQQEYNTSFEMIESNTSGAIIGMTGANRGAYMEIVTSSNQFYEGLIIWAYKSLLVREPTAAEIQIHLQDLVIDKNFQELQVQIMLTDEYANF